MPDLAWMAWTPETAVFFAAIALLLGLMILWHGLLGVSAANSERRT